MKKVNRINIIDKETEAEFYKKRLEKQADIIINLAKERDGADKLLDQMTQDLMSNAFSGNNEVIDDDSIVADRVLGPITFSTQKELEGQLKIKQAEHDVDVAFLKLASKLNEIETKKSIPEEFKFLNESNLEFTDISSEQYRIYEFNNGKIVMIVEPLKLNVSKSGGHRVYDSSGISHYIPQGWCHLSWKTKLGKPNFVK
jgi:hypothetical protein